MAIYFHSSGDGRSARFLVVAGTLAIIAGAVAVTGLGISAGRADLIGAGLAHGIAGAVTLGILAAGTRRVRPFARMDPEGPVTWLVVACSMQLLAWEFDPVANNALVAAMFAQPPGVLELAATHMSMALVGLTGAGLGTRRGWAATAQRLGLNLPKLGLVFQAAAVGVALSAIGLMVRVLLPDLAGPACASQAVALAGIGDRAARGPLMQILLVTVVSLGEDTLFRGALQPRIGLWLSALLCALTSVYTCGGYPSVTQLYILGLAVAFGVLRDRGGLPASMIAHATYNLTVFSLAAGW
jgi:membrane protease YdiL (CAAX protease family)